MPNNNDSSGTTALLLLPGLMCGDAFWQPLLPALGSSVRPKIADYGDADTLAGMAQAVLDHAPAKFVLAGHSMGGRVALEVARIAPERVQKLILMDTGCGPRLAGEKGDNEKAGRMALVDIAKTQGVRAMCAEWVKGMVHPDRLTDAALLEAITVMFEQKTAARFARQQHALINRPDAGPVLAALKVPVLIVCGRQDAWANVAQHEALQKLAADATLKVIENAGHMVLMERPAETAQVINEFLQSPLSPMER